jgi:cysteinyl-tRNA synthetase
MHSAFVMVEGKRIGKSEGNAIRLYQLEERGIPALAYRYLAQTTHYRQPMNFTWEAAEAAKTARERALRFFADISSGPIAHIIGKIDQNYRTAFQAAIDDDLNMPEAIALMWNLIKDEKVPPADKRETLLDFDRVLGIGFLPLLYRSDSPERLEVVAHADLPQEIDLLITEREEARKSGLWERADELRQKLRGEGYSVEDTKEGPIVRRL